MKNRLLKAKHWQLFLLTFAIPLILQVTTIISIFSNIATETHPDPEKLFNYMKIFPVIMVLFTSVLFSWHWSVAIGLQSKVPINVTMKTRKFKIFFFIPLIYIALLIIFFSVSADDFFTLNEHQSLGLIVGLFFVIFPLHLFSVFCMFYTLYFVAKVFKTVELQREVKFTDFAGEFFMIWFYPFGIWILQPKINRMIEQ